MMNERPVVGLSERTFTRAGTDATGKEGGWNRCWVGWDAALL